MNDGGYLTGDKLQQDIYGWLAPPDPWKNYNIARGWRHSGTGAWFMQGNTLSEWMESGPSSLLWIHGKRQWCCPASTLTQRLMVFVFVAGAGKSVIWYVNPLNFWS